MSTENKLAKLSSAQYQELKDALPLITILIAGADGKVDPQELNWAEKLTHIRTYANPEELNGFYEDVQTTFRGDLEKLMSSLPGSITSREEIISNRLKGLNDILSSLENRTAFVIYSSFTSFAEHIAKASGGFFRFGSISHEEKHWIGLPMITPIVLEEGLED
jgi:hypothetical protein